MGKHSCIVCGTECIMMKPRSSWEEATLKPWVMLDVDHIIGWYDRLVCKKCWETKGNRDIIKKILWERGKDLLKRRIGYKQEYIKKLKKELNEEQDELRKFKQQFTNKDAGLTGVYKSSDE